MSTDRREGSARVPGWTLLKAPGKGVRYRAPDGSEVGYYAYKSALTHYQKTGVAPQSPLGTRWMQYQKEGASIFSGKNHDITAVPEMRKEIHLPGSDDTLVLDVPEPKLTSTSKSKSGLFSSRELSEGFQAILIIATSILAAVSQLPEAQMTDMELKAICVPLGNIIERSKFNKVVGNAVVGKNDYFTLGYALYVYVDRVSSASRERKYANNQSFGNAGQTQGYGPVGGSNGNGPVIGVPLRVTPSGLRNFTQ